MTKRSEPTVRKCVRQLTDVLILRHVRRLRALAAVAERGGGDEPEEGQEGAEHGAGHGEAGLHLLG